MCGLLKDASEHAPCLVTLFLLLFLLLFVVKEGSDVGSVESREPKSAEILVNRQGRVGVEGQEEDRGG